MGLRRYVIGVGANLGDRLATMRAAMGELRAADVLVDQTSRVYVTAPVGPAQPDFLNAAALVRFGATPLDLLDVLLSVERRLGRLRRLRWGPRTIDLDLLWGDGVAVKNDRLTVPHPHLRERAFAVVPLLELVPDACDPHTRERYRVPAGQVRATAEVL